MKPILSIFSFLLISIFFLFTSCESNDERVGGFPQEGQIWADIEDLSYTFDDPSGTLVSIANTYSESVQTLSIYRSSASNALRLGSFRVLLTRFDFDNTTPRILDNTNVRFSFEPQQNTMYTAVGGDIRFEILSIEDDIIKANFSGTLQNSLNSNQQIRVRNGSLNIKIRRE
ncbi:hypothetical protein Fleli_4040 [Bernardetia litoralis DSM 6794]|uniref:Uncharacterized protein n=1 Tax=Bernardetia litoralis (strain ATCC 23117 / DSM 6794 / NBRC 15988 / NCIMB 1366 / Fx l1 / Sio-4) TaxID=880071 RepID=I4AQV3_BERLS|nr:hypothetical protein [Bernardetia litoralis]AFM06338.1 hypothetical protein Fleli_4040 [Bernardetia litoralis DSM 6794]